MVLTYPPVLEDGMRRRSFIAGLGSAAAWPVVARAQPAMPLLGFLFGIDFRRPSTQAYLAAFREGLSSTGYVEGQNLRIEFREAEGQYDRLPGLAADLVRLQPAVIVAAQLPAALAATAATATIPIVFTAADDPVKNGLVASLRSPGGNATGVNPMVVEPEGKRIGLLHELVPSEEKIGVLFNPNSADASSHLADIEAAGNSLGLELVIINVSDESGLGNAFAWIDEQQIGALLVAADPLFSGRIERLVSLAIEYKLPAVFSLRNDALAGGLMSTAPALLIRIDN